MTITALLDTVSGWSFRHRLFVAVVLAALALVALDRLRQAPLDVLPDLAGPRVVVYGEWPGRAPDLVEEQVTAPLAGALQGAPGAHSVRGHSLFGLSLIHVLLDDDADAPEARAGIEQLLREATHRLPEGVVPAMAPETHGAGPILQYVLEDRGGRYDAAQLRGLQETTIRPALLAVPGVAEVASIGGVEQQYLVQLDPNRLAALGLSLGDVARAVRDANAEAGTRLLELAGREFVLRGRGQARTPADLEDGVVTVNADGTPIRLGDVASVRLAPNRRRTAADLDGEGDAVGGIVTMRAGALAPDVSQALQRRIATLALPGTVRLVPTYDRAAPLRESRATLRAVLVRQIAIVALASVVLFLHVGAAVAVLLLTAVPLALALSLCHALGMPLNLVTFGGCTIAFATLTVAALIQVEGAYARLARESLNPHRQKMLLAACRELASSLTLALLLVAVGFLPLLALGGAAGRLFAPLAWQGFVPLLLAALGLVVVAPALLHWTLSGRVLVDAENPILRWFGRGYLPLVRGLLPRPRLAVALLLALPLLTVPVARRLGTELLPTFAEGALLILPTTLPGISVDETRRALAAQNRVIKGFPEVAAVHARAGIDGMIDSAQFDRGETIVTLRPRREWPLQDLPRWYSGWLPEAFRPLLREFWPERRPRLPAELMRDLAAALRLPGYRFAITTPLRAGQDRSLGDMRTPIGVKVFGPDIATIERLSLVLEEVLRAVPGTRGTFAERHSGREYIDITPDRDALGRYGLTVRDVLDVAETAVGGMPVATVFDGRARYAVNLGFAADYRADPETLRRLLVSVPAGERPRQFDPADAFRPVAPTVPLATLAQVRIASGPPLLRSENGVPVGYVWVDLDSPRRDPLRWVAAARKLVAAQLTLPPEYRLEWTGQQELLAAQAARLGFATLPAAALMLGLVLLALGSPARLLLLAPPLLGSWCGGLWLLALLGQHVSVPVLFGGVAATGCALLLGMKAIVQLDRACAGARTLAEISAAVASGCTASLRPVLASALIIVLGLWPLLRNPATGADLFAHFAAPLVGGIALAALATLLLLPPQYLIWRRRQLARPAAAP
ncbi:MAG: efflux RND transporter permease subunit [Gammaproteobacteria bacterium]|nr:efflux RND transporter permease subunit [Gammaproteobacteria bacterium]